MFIISIESNLCVRHATKFIPINFILILIRQGRRNDFSIQLEFKPWFVELQSLYPTMMPFKNYINLLISGSF